MPGVARRTGLGKALALRWLDETATVYEAGPAGAFDQVVRADLKCKLVALNREGAENEDREELSQRRRFCWEPGYVLPEHNVQIDVSGERWNPDPSSYREAEQIAGQVAYRVCEVVRG